MADSFLEFDDLLSAIDDRSYNRPPALVSNAHITGLSVARALAIHDVPVIALDRTDNGVAPSSTAIDLAGRITYPLDDLDGFQADIEEIAAALGWEPIAFPCMDEWVHAYAQTEPEGVRLPFANREVIDGVLNKFALYERTERLDIPYPETYRLDTTDPDDAAEALGFPLVIKPALKREFEEVMGTNIIEVNDSAEYHDVINSAREGNVEIMAQEKVPIERGRDHSLVSYVPNDKDRETVTFTGNPVIRYPLSFGTSCVVKRSLEPAVEANAVAVLEDAGYYGISEAEFVYDSDRETFVLLDINTRPWKWIGLPVFAGANLPWAAYAEAIGDDYDVSISQEATWVYLPDYIRLLATNRTVDDVLTSADWRALLSGSFENGSTITTGVYSPSDPGPAQQVLETTFGHRQYYCSC